MRRSTPAHPIIKPPALRPSDTVGKVFMGMSDITVLNLALHAATGLVIFNGPTVVFGLAEYPRKPPIGCVAEFDTARRRFAIIEAAVG
ncbi:MAG TPA: LD-carboxypeptidase [Thermomicrobiales bacterium]|nr:LD-carboxypeptidase [Thermomicrobiales bacterium]